jgi:hypothetical protein
MNEHSDPIEFLIEFAWANGADRFLVNNAKDELKNLKEKAQDTDRWLNCERDLYKLRQIFENPVAYGKLNDELDLYDLRIQNNPHDDQDKVVPLYSNRQEFLKGDWKGYNTYGKSTK